MELGTSDDSTAVWASIELFDGGGEEYRLITANKRTRTIIEYDTLANDTLIPEYGEELVLHGLETRILGKLGAGQVLNLGMKSDGSMLLRGYPNPADDKITICISGRSEEWRMKLVSSMGIELMQSSVIGNVWQIDTSRFPAGVYSVVAEGGEMRRGNLRFVIVR